MKTTWNYDNSRNNVTCINGNCFVWKTTSLEHNENVHFFNAVHYRLKHLELLENPTCNVPHYT